MADLRGQGLADSHHRHVQDSERRTEGAACRPTDQAIGQGLAIVTADGIVIGTTTAAFDHGLPTAMDIRDGPHTRIPL